MNIKNLFDEFNKYSTIMGCNSISSQYDKIIEFVSFVFCSSKYSELEKREIYLEILALYGQLDKKD